MYSIYHKIRRVFLQTRIGDSRGVWTESTGIFTIQMDFCDNPTVFPEMYFVDDPYIHRITIDRRIERKFTAPGFGEGTILVKPDAIVEELACAIMLKLGVTVD